MERLQIYEHRITKEKLTVINNAHNHMVTVRDSLARVFKKTKANLYVEYKRVGYLNI